MRTFILSCALALGSLSTFAQGYQFTDVVKVPATPVKNQASTGTCWCFATTSFMESELLRMGKGTYDLSEMFIVRQKYMNQLQDNYVRQGRGNIGQGSLSHTFMNAFNQVGIVPEEVYSGINYDSDRHNHAEMVKYIKAIATTAVDMKKRSPEYYKLIDNLFDTYLGKLPEKFTYQGKEYTPKTFAASLGLNMDDYIELTSFTHHPYYQKFEVEVPDNWEHAQMYNLPLNEMMEVADYALNNGYTVCWDGDVSEKGFSFKNGVAINPEVKKVEDYSTTDRARFEKMDEKERLEEVYKFEKPFPEVNVTPQVRQEGFEAFVTTDDHLMHLTGIAKDQNGTKYYITKNSWGTERNTFGGSLNMSDSFVRAKTIYIMVHKDAIPKAIKSKLGIISSLEWASAEITDAHLFFLSSNQFQLLNQPRAFTPFIDHEKDIADIYADATLQIRFKSDITTHRLPVTVESKSNQTGVLIEYRATGITTRDIIVREEAQLQFPFFICVRSEITATNQIQYLRLYPELIARRVLFL